MRSKSRETTSRLLDLVGFMFRGSINNMIEREERRNKKECFNISCSEHRIPISHYQFTLSDEGAHRIHS